MLKRVLNSAFCTVFLLSFVCATNANAALILQWNTFGNAGTETTESSTFNAANFQSSILNFEGSVVNPAANGNRFGGNNWSTGATSAAAVATNNFFQFTVTPTDGASYNATSLEFIWDRSGTGPSSVALRTSIDNFATDVGSLTGLTGSTSTVRTLTISGVSNVSSATTFRLYGYNAGGATGTAGFDTGTNAPNVSFNGDITAVPEPSSIALVSLMGCTALMAAYRRRNAKSKVA